MATIVTQARNNTPWWAPLAVNVLGGLWNDWQQNERNKKESALAAEAAKILSPQVTEETPAASLPNMANTGLSDTGLLNMGMATPKGYDDNGWASIFHKNYTPLTQFDLGTAGVTPAMSPSVPATPLGLSNNSGNLSNWANAMRNSDSPLSQFDMGTAGIVPASTAPTQDTTSGTPAPAVTNMGRNTGVPTPLDFYRQYMELKGSKRFGMVGNEASQKILEPLMKLLEATRQEELRNALANEYIAATDTAIRNNTAAGGLLRGTIGSDVFNSIRQANTPTPHFTDIGGAVVPSMFDPWTGQITRGDEWAKSPTPGEVMTNAHNKAVLDENARQFNITSGLEREKMERDDAFRNNPTMIVGGDGNYWQYYPETGTAIPTDVLAPDSKLGVGTFNDSERMQLKTFDDKIAENNKKIAHLEARRKDTTTDRMKAEIDDPIAVLYTENEALRKQKEETARGFMRQRSGRTQNAFNIVGGHNFTAKTANGRQYNDIINKYTEIHDVDPDLIVAMIMQESGFNPKAKSGAGAMGLMQLMPETAKELGVTDPYDPEQNIRGGIDYIAQQLRAFNGDLYKALWAYNAGPGNARKGRMPKPSETRKYISNVIANYRRLKGNRNQVAATPQVTGLGLPPVDPKYLQNQPVLGLPPINQKSLQDQMPTELPQNGQPTQGTATSDDTPAFRRNSDGKIFTHSDIEALKNRADNGEFQRFGVNNRNDVENWLVSKKNFSRLGNDSTSVANTATRSPEMPQASMQETANTQQGLAMLNGSRNPFAFIGFDGEYPFLESDDIWPQYNDPIEDPDYSPIPNIDQPQLPRIFRV